MNHPQKSPPPLTTPPIAPPVRPPATLAEQPASSGQFLPTPVGPYLCRPARPEETHDALRLVLSNAGYPADDVRILDFLRYATARKIDLSRLAVVERPASDTFLTSPFSYALLPVLSPGRTALLLAPSGVATPARDAAGKLVDLVVSSLPDLLLAQSLVDPEDESAQAPFLASGFTRLASLLYLQREISRPTVVSPSPHHYRPVNYSAATHDLFAQALLASYEQSLDCPSLNGVRDISDVIEGHKYAGAEFDPNLWTVLMDGDSPAAVLLLSATGNGETLELVYLGVSARYRRQGLAHWCLRHAMHETHRAHLPKLTLAVDQANQPALKLYYRFGMKRVHERVALVRILR